ncbi:MAG: hypothetical protein HOA15_04030 [Candidatus Marinimicrobia bacterium]|jgi:hypothetical protein|nr:hypothetical protein [Candidatus Neomarinimicrobiota bacterium]MBT4068156.1 hypothetical protein [Candidatus Neomarinimicrobiota bacterium]MBT4270106.1 hypothetical protein [Candidatus Neomarinimicrobiota bacterium]MBT4371250.1 hypothetical protein [Candidatus Neomarinimicrobiota bacterium]MBT4809751.1 hypothetical protein [Candidatus Neomarinimicrobiota bacterium]
MTKDYNEFSFLRILRFVFYTLSAIAIYFAGTELNSNNLKLAAAFLVLSGLLGIIRNLQRLSK